MDIDDTQVRTALCLSFGLGAGVEKSTASTVVSPWPLGGLLYFLASPEIEKVVRDGEVDKRVAPCRLASLGSPR